MGIYCLVLEVTGAGRRKATHLQMMFTRGRIPMQEVAGWTSDVIENKAAAAERFGRWYA